VTSCLRASLLFFFDAATPHLLPFPSTTLFRSRGGVARSGPAGGPARARSDRGPTLPGRCRPRRGGGRRRPPSRREPSASPTVKRSGEHTPEIPSLTQILFPLLPLKNQKLHYNS